MEFNPPDYITKLSLKDIAIIDALPILHFDKTVLTVGCGKANLEWYLAQMGLSVLATDIELEQYPNTPNLSFCKLNILETPTMGADVVICSEVLEHLEDYRTAYKHLLVSARRRLIITVPYKYSFNSPGHINHWDDNSILEFKELAKPFLVMITRIRTKPLDLQMRQWAYLIVVDKIQKYEMDGSM